MISTNRQLIKHGPVSVTSLNKSQFTYFLLFSDVAVFASPSAKSAKKLDMKEIIQLEQVARSAHAALHRHRMAHGVSFFRPH
jgi:hypothetical protein